MGRDGGDAQLVDGLVGPVVHIDGGGGVGEEFGDEALVEAGELSHEEGLGDGGAVDAVVDTDRVERAEPKHELVEADHVICASKGGGQQQQPEEEEAVAQLPTATQYIPAWQWLRKNWSD